MATEGFETELDAYRERVERPLWRLFRAYVSGKMTWLAVALLTSILAYGTLLVTPIVLGTTIDAVFTGESAYALPFVPGAWLPTEPAGQFWLSAAVVGGALLGGAVLQYVRGVAINVFAHGVMYEVRVEAYRKMQRLDMTFFDNKETGEVMSILNNDTSNLETFFDNAVGDSVRIGVIVGGVTTALLYTNWQLALVTLGAVPLLVGFTWWFMRVIEPRYTRQRETIGDLNVASENNAFQSSFADGKRQLTTDLEGLLEADPEVIIWHGGYNLIGGYSPGWYDGGVTWEDDIVGALQDDPVASEVTAVQEGQILPGNIIEAGPVTNLFNTEDIAKQLYPEEFGAFHAGEYGESEQLFDRQRLADIINGDLDDE